MPDVYHGSASEIAGNVVKAGREGTHWWRVIDHDVFLDPPYDEGDPDHNMEMDHDVRTAYGNTVYEVFASSQNPDLKDMAHKYGLHGLGEEVGILFVGMDRNYVESRYGPSVQIDLEAEGVLAIIPDDNVPSGGCWMVVMRAGSPMPISNVSTPAP